VKVELGCKQIQLIHPVWLRSGFLYHVRHIFGACPTNLHVLPLFLDRMVPHCRPGPRCYSTVCIPRCAAHAAIRTKPRRTSHRGQRRALQAHSVEFRSRCRRRACACSNRRATCVVQAWRTIHISMMRMGSFVAAGAHRFLHSRPILYHCVRENYLSVDLVQF
jgi:hypothetical protein